MATSVIVATCRALMVTGGAGEEVCSSWPESVTVMTAGERQMTRYRPEGSQAENFPAFPTRRTVRPRGCGLTGRGTAD